MHSSVRALLHQIIDYAGLFPPAKLPLEKALRTYLDAKKSSPYARMLGRFVCPVGRLPELLALAKGHPGASFLSLTVLARQASTPSDFFTELKTDLYAIDDFRREWGIDAVADLIEIPLPAEADVDALLEYARPLSEDFVEAKVRGFLELGMSAQWESDVGKMARGLGEICQFGGKTPCVWGLKLRCGGVTANAFPTNEQIAFFIGQCTIAGMPWKATAGLHHPRRHWDAKLQVWHHGFLNVFIAGVLALGQAFGLKEAEIAEILADRDGRHFRFDADSIAWKAWSCNTAQIAEARANFATSFGSCSFEEPIHDLLAMGLLDDSA